MPTHCHRPLPPEGPDPPRGGGAWTKGRQPQRSSRLPIERGRRTLFFRTSRRPSRYPTPAESRGRVQRVATRSLRRLADAGLRAPPCDAAHRLRRRAKRGTCARPEGEDRSGMSSARPCTRHAIRVRGLLPTRQAGTCEHRRRPDVGRRGAPGAAALGPATPAGSRTPTRAAPPRPAARPRTRRTCA